MRVLRACVYECVCLCAYMSMFVCACLRVYTVNIQQLQYKFQRNTIHKPTYNVKGEKLAKKLVILHEHGERTPVLELERIGRKHTYVYNNVSSINATRWQ